MNPSTDLAIDSLSPSRTHIQKLRRERFDAKLLQELADSIKGVGVVQPIVVRAILDARPGKPDTKFEIVVGERRWLASKKAGLTTIPVTIRELNDDQVLEVQLIENLQRENLHELEEAEGYEELMKLKKINADAVADMVGRSRSYVFRRTKLLSLCPEARKAFYAGSLDASRALLIARIGHHDTQRAALKDLQRQGDQWRGPMTYRQALEHIQNEYMLKLKDAPFDIADADLVPKAGSCQACPKRTGNQKELFADVKSGDVCTDPKCFDEKRQAIYFARMAYESQTGRMVTETGFVHHKTMQYVGGSVDGLIDADGIIEIKCPTSATHLQTMLTEECEHMAQIQGYLWITDREWCDFISFDPRLPVKLSLYVKRIERDPLYIAQLKDAVTQFLAEVGAQHTALLAL